MNHLVILAHPNPKSFNAAIAMTINDTLKELGHTVFFRDLYELEFNPVLSLQDLKNAFSGEYADDLRIEQKFLLEADYIHFISPLWWNGFPAMMKGYFDRVFTKGFAYEYKDGEHCKCLKDRKAIVYTTAGASESAIVEFEIEKTLRKVLNEGIFDFAGIELLEHFFLAGVTSVSDEDRKEMLLKIKEYLTKI